LQIRELQSRFKSTIPISDGFFRLMQVTFGFYSDLCNDFFANLGRHVEANTLGAFLQNEIRPRLFDLEYCKTIEATKKQFLAENIKLEQFIEQNAFKEDFINDLSALKKVSDAIYELLQTHWEFFKYEKSVANNEVMIAFLLEIDRVGIRWDSYLDKYLAISSLLKMAEGKVEREGYTPLMVQYHLPKNTRFPIEMSGSLILFLQTAYEFVIKVANPEAETNELEVAALEVGNPVNCLLMVPNAYMASYQKFLGYCSVDVLKRETLLTYVMEVCEAEGVEFWVLDRPDPMGGTCVGGPSIDPVNISFIGVHEVPQVYGLTPGEWARLIQRERTPQLRVVVVPMQGWRRGMRGRPQRLFSTVARCNRRPKAATGPLTTGPNGAKAAKHTWLLIHWATCWRCT